MNFLESLIETYRKQKDLAERAFNQLPDEQLRGQIDPETNSILVIMKHVSGNLKSRWTEFLESDGEKAWRNRDDEFVDNFASVAEGKVYWEEGWKVLFDTLESLTEADLNEVVTIRGEEHSVYLAAHRSLAHTSYHIGQIVQLSRHFAGENWETLTIARGKSEEFNREMLEK